VYLVLFEELEIHTLFFGSIWLRFSEVCVLPHFKGYVIAFWQGIPRQNPAISLRCDT
jgi:hypothetical protein